MSSTGLANLLRRLSLTAPLDARPAGPRPGLAVASLFRPAWAPWWWTRLSRCRQALRRRVRRACQRHGRVVVGVALLSTSYSKPLIAEARFNRNGNRPPFQLANQSLPSPDLPDKLLLNHVSDIKRARQLIEQTLTCARCGKRLMINAEVKGVEYCRCEENSGKNQYGVQTEGIPWLPFLEKPGIIVWRQEHPELPGMYVYKMYGRFEDITPCEYLQVQMDLSPFRLKWDENAVQVRVIEELMEEQKNSLSQIYYWEVSWPRFFSNRDYVCNRRSQIFNADNVGVMYSRGTTHPSAPVNTRNVRVEDYWSVLTLQPTQSWNDQGLEFCLTAFENPGVSMPSSITTWVAMRGMPEFMEQLRQACLTLREWKEKQSITMDAAANEGSLLAILSMPMPDEEAAKHQAQAVSPASEKTVPNATPEQIIDPAAIVTAENAATKAGSNKEEVQPVSKDVSGDEEVGKPPTVKPVEQHRTAEDKSSESQKFVYVKISL